MSADVTILTSAFKPWEYADQYCAGIARWKQEPAIAQRVNLMVYCTSPDPVQDQERLKKFCDLVIEAGKAAGVANVYAVVLDKNLNYPETINLMLPAVQTRFVGILNLDDYRDIKAIDNQMATLDRVDITYGDFMVTDDIKGFLAGEKVKTTTESTYDFSNNAVTYYQSVFKWGPFFMWRRELNEVLLGYDEHLTVAADFDWINRVLGYGYRWARTGGIMGLFLAVGKGLSTRPDTLGHQENQFVLQRFLYAQNPNIIYNGKPIAWRSLKR